MRFLRKKRKYPIKYSAEGLTIRQMCFRLFSEGMRPTEVARENNFNLRTTRTYFSQWKKLPRGFAKRWQFFKRIKERNPELLDEMAVMLGAQLGFTEAESIEHLQMPWGLRSMLAGTWDNESKAAVKAYEKLIEKIFFCNELHVPPENAMRYVCEFINEYQGIQKPESE